MPLVEFSDKQLLQGTVVEPGWYIMRIEDIGEKPSKDGGSVNYPVEGIIISHENGDTKFANVPVTWNFNSKAMGFSVGFLKAFGVDVKANQRYDLNSAIGRTLKVFVENDTYEGRLVNRVNHKYAAA